MSSHLQWMVVRNNSAFLIKGAHNQTFSTVCNKCFFFLFISLLLIGDNQNPLIITFFGSSDHIYKIVLTLKNMRIFLLISFEP